MNVTVFCIGHSPKGHEEAWINDYLARARKFAPVELVRLKEGTRMIDRIPETSFRVVLDEKGKPFTTADLSKLFDRAARANRKGIAFVIGGAYGVPVDVSAKADVTMSLSPLTLPHRLALLVLCEQIYRVLSWRARAPYHHA